MARNYSPIVSYINELQSASITYSTAAADGDAVNAVDGNTYDYWTTLGGGTNWIQFDLPVAKQVDCWGICAHTLASTNSTVQIQYDNGGGWVDVASGDLAGQTDWSMFVVLTTPVTSAKWRVYITGSDSAISIGSIHAGPLLEFERNIYVGHKPILFGDQVKIKVNRSDTGRLLGSSVVKSGAATKVNFSNLTPDFVRNDLIDFVRHFNNGYSFWWAWYVDRFNIDSAYCWRSGGEVKVKNTGVRDFMSVGFELRGYRDGEIPAEIVREVVVSSTVYPVATTDELVTAIAITGGEVKDLTIDAPTESLGLSGSFAGTTYRTIKVTASDQIEDDSLSMTGNFTGTTFRRVKVTAPNQIEDDSLTMTGNFTAADLRVARITAADQAEDDSLALSGNFTAAGFI